MTKAEEKGDFFTIETKKRERDNLDSWAKIKILYCD